MSPMTGYDNLILGLQLLRPYLTAPGTSEHGDWFWVANYADYESWRHIKIALPPQVKKQLNDAGWFEDGDGAGWGTKLLE